MATQLGCHEVRRGASLAVPRSQKVETAVVEVTTALQAVLVEAKARRWGEEITSRSWWWKKHQWLGSRSCGLRGFAGLDLRQRENLHPLDDADDY